MMLTLILAASLAAADAWPSIEADTLAGGKARVPAGKVSIVVVGFSKESGSASKAWVERYTRDGSLAFMAPVLEGAPRLIRGLIRSGMRKDIPPALHQRTLLIYSGEADWKRRVGFVNGTEKHPYVILFDREGRPQWIHHGPFDEGVYKELRQRAAALTN